MSTAAERIAGLFANAWTSHHQFDADAASGPQSADDAYLVQDRVFTARYPGQRASVWIG